MAQSPSATPGRTVLAALLAGATLLTALAPATAAAQDRWRGGDARERAEDRRDDRRDDRRGERRYDRREDDRRGQPRRVARPPLDAGAERWRQDRRDDDRRYGDRRWSDRDDRQVRWDGGWRQDRRYDWRGYRQTYGHAYRLPRYQSPYRGYGYQRYGIGWTLRTGYFQDRYVLADPWRYRLPAVGYPLRWVRYYDDVLLVNVRSGRVLDVVHDFFW